MGWKKRVDRVDRGAFLEGTSSDLADFGQTGSDAFASAWDAHTETETDTTSLDAFGPPEEDKRTRRARDLDRRSRRGMIVLGALVVAGLAAGIAVRQGLLGDPTGLAPTLERDVNVIVSIDDPRVYTDGPSTLALTPTSPIDTGFAGSSGTNPAPTQDVTGVADGSAFGTVFWGGRSHVAVVGSGLDPVTSCIVVTLVADDLRVVDLASYGACGDRYDATGDRSACVGDGIVLLEVWPYDPDAVVERPAVAATRVRIERADAPGGVVESLRGTAPLDDVLLEDAMELRGHPGDDTRVEIGTSTGTCTLVDRAEVPVQLL